MSSLQVVGAGFGRTGTDSLKQALEILYGQPCYHMREVFTHKDHVWLWIEVADGKEPQWEKIFKGYAAACDFPVSSYWQELFAKYPNAKIVLTNRPFEDWYSSCLETIYPASSGFFGLLSITPFFRAFREMTSKVVWNNPKLFGGQFLDKEVARRVYEQNIADAKRIVPADKLLIFNVAEGWEPLCKFLGKPVPDKPFPRVNDKESFKRNIRKMKLVGWGATAVVVALVAVGVQYLLKRFSIF